MENRRVKMREKIIEMIVSQLKEIMLRRSLCYKVNSTVRKRLNVPLTYKFMVFGLNFDLTAVLLFSLKNSEMANGKW